MKHCNIPIFIPELACKNKCIFCNQHKISGQNNIPSPQEVKDIIEKYLTTTQNKETEIAFFGGNFTGIDKKLQIQYLETANLYINNNNIKGIRISTRPDYIDEEILQILKKYNVTAIEIGVQSTDNEVLNKAKRGHSVADIVNAAKLIKKYNFQLGMQMMIGLPEDNFEKSFQTAKDIINLNAQTTRIYPTLVIKNTEMEQLFLNKKFVPISLEQAIEWTKHIYKLFENNNVKILRTGLHKSDELTPEKSLIAGPFHHAFFELVMTEIWKDLLCNILEKTLVDILPPKITIQTSAAQINYAIGYEGKNKKYLLTKYKNVNFIANKNFDKYQVMINESKN